MAAVYSPSSEKQSARRSLYGRSHLLNAPRVKSMLANVPFIAMEYLSPLTHTSSRRLSPPNQLSVDRTRTAGAVYALDTQPKIHNKQEVGLHSFFIWR